MKFLALLSAGLIAVTGLSVAAPADAQSRGWHDDRGYDRDYRNDRRDDRRWRGDRRDDRGWRGDRRDRDGWHRGRANWQREAGWRGRGRDRGRVVCRTERSYYGPVRNCFRVYR